MQEPAPGTALESVPAGDGDGIAAFEAEAESALPPVPAPERAGVERAGRSGLLTYEPYYGLVDKPFSLSTCPPSLYRSASHAAVCEALLDGIRRREGLVVLTGGVGTGKTTVCRAVLAKLDRKTFTTFVPDPFVSREDLLKMLLVDFGVASVEEVVRGRLSGASRAELSYPLYDFLTSLEPIDAFAVLIIDEAQNLGAPLLEEIRILADLEVRGRRLLQVVLVGQPELRADLRLGRMRQVQQRVSVHCDLAPLTREGVSGYVAHRLAAVGGTDERVRFVDEALDYVFQASCGVPRVINLICDRALHLGRLAQCQRITRALVEEARAGLTLLEPVSDDASRLPESSGGPSVHVSPVPPAAAPTPAVPPAGSGAVVPGSGSAPSGLAAPPAAFTNAADVTPARGTDPTSSSLALRSSAERRPDPHADPLASKPRVIGSGRKGSIWAERNAPNARRTGPSPLAVMALTALGVMAGVGLVLYTLWLKPLIAARARVRTVPAAEVPRTPPAPQPPAPATSSPSSPRQTVEPHDELPPLAPAGATSTPPD